MSTDTDRCTTRREGQYLRAVRARRDIPERVSEGIWQRVRLLDGDGRTVLDRWGVALERVGGVLVHYMQSPDPGGDLHDHPWSFVSIVLWGGYTEWRAYNRDAGDMAMIADAYPTTCTPGVLERRGWLSVRMMRLDECHKTVRIDRVGCVTLCLRGPRRRSWGFYLSDGYVGEKQYKQTERGKLRTVTTVIGT